MTIKYDVEIANIQLETRAPSLILYVISSLPYRHTCDPARFLLSIMHPKPAWSPGGHLESASLHLTIWHKSSIRQLFDVMHLLLENEIWMVRMIAMPAYPKSSATITRMFGRFAHTDKASARNIDIIIINSIENSSQPRIGDGAFSRPRHGQRYQHKWGHSKLVKIQQNLPTYSCEAARTFLGQ